LRGRTGLVQREVDLERAGLRVVVARRVVAHGGAAFGPHRAFGAHGGQAQLAGGGVGKEQLHVVVEARAVEAREVVAGERDADQVRRHALHRLHREPAKAQLVAHPAGRAVRHDGGRGRW